jgi:hypothetical protein
VDEHFINLAFNHCSRGEDLEFIMALDAKREVKQDTRKLSLKNLKKLGETLRAEKYVFLSSDLILNEREYVNLVAELTYDKEDSFRA